MPREEDLSHMKHLEGYLHLKNEFDPEMWPILSADNFTSDTEFLTD